MTGVADSKPYVQLFGAVEVNQVSDDDVYFVAYLDGVPRRMVWDMSEVGEAEIIDLTLALAGILSRRVSRRNRATQEARARLNGSGVTRVPDNEQVF